MELGNRFDFQLDFHGRKKMWARVDKDIEDILLDHANYIITHAANMTSIDYVRVHKNFDSKSWIFERLNQRKSRSSQRKTSEQRKTKLKEAT